MNNDTAPAVLGRTLAEDVKLNRKMGIWLLRGTFDNGDGTLTCRSMLVLAGGTNRARFLARLDTGDDQWEGPEVTPELLGLATREQAMDPDRVIGKMGEWE